MEPAWIVPSGGVLHFFIAFSIVGVYFPPAAVPPLTHDGSMASSCTS